MNVIYYALQRHTETGEPRENLICTGQVSEIYYGQHIELDGTKYQVEEIRNRPKGDGLNVLCLERTACGNTILTGARDE